MFLLDTDVVSLLRRQDRHPFAARWLEAQRPSDLYLSVVTIGEVERGIARQLRRDPAFARSPAAWLDSVLGAVRQPHGEPVPEPQTAAAVVDVGVMAAG